jgi:hypothetical protein
VDAIAECSKGKVALVDQFRKFLQNDKVYDKPISEPKVQADIEASGSMQSPAHIAQKNNSGSDALDVRLEDKYKAWYTDNSGFICGKTINVTDPVFLLGSKSLVNETMEGELVKQIYFPIRNWSLIGNIYSTGEEER